MFKNAFKQLIRKLFWSDFQRFLTDKQYAVIRYWLEQNAWLNLKDPQKFTEKIQYIKLNDHRELRKTLTDRIKVRDYVAQKIGKSFLIPLIGVYDTLSAEIWQSLPKQFVLKANHGSGMVKIVSDKTRQSYQQVHRQTEKWKDVDFYKKRRQWAYKDLPRTIVAEKLMLDSSGSVPKDYKFFCFNGRVKLIEVDYDRFENHRRNMYDQHFNRIEGRLLYPNYSGNVEQPPNFKKAVEIAERLSSDLNFLRVDLYLLQDNIYFGELTNYPGNGMVPFEPPALELKVGSWLEL